MMSLLGAIVSVWLAVSAAAGASGREPGSVAAPGGLNRSAATREDPASLLDLSDEELLKRIEADPACLGSVSIGSPSSAMVLNAVPLPEDPRWTAAPGAVSWGTSETMAAIETAVATVCELFPDTRPVVIGDISHAEGGRLKRHASHQAGRDADFGFYYKSEKSGYYTSGTAANLDLPRNWAFVRALVARTDVEVVFLDTRIQRLLYQYALSISEDKAWLDESVFRFVKGSRQAIVQHEPRHRTHYHVRFYNPVAQELGRRAHPLLVQLKIVDPPVFTVRHVVRAGQTMGYLAARYGTSVRAIQQANGLRSTFLRAGRAYRIPVKSVAPASEPVVVPLRQLPPSTPLAVASIAWPTVESLYADRIRILAQLATQGLGFGVIRF